MLFITTYKVKPYITKAETAELMEVFAKQGSAPGEIAHYVNADGGGGVVISDTAGSRVSMGWRTVHQASRTKRSYSA